MSETIISQDQADIQKALMDYYHDGHALYDPELYIEILHPDWKFFLLDEGKLKIIDRDEFCDWYAPEKKPLDLKWETEIYKIDVTGKLAAVKLRIENQRVRYIDYLNMMKIDGKWWIVHKISHDISK
jgi:hypothetical protein